MIRTYWFACAVEIASIAVAPQPSRAVEADNRAAIGLFDTLAPLAEDAAREGLQAKRGWQEVPDNERDHRFRGDAARRTTSAAAVISA